LSGSEIARTSNGSFFAWADGSYQYPTDPSYADDAADLAGGRAVLRSA